MITKEKVLPFLVAMLVLASCASFADPGIARSPVSIRQTYSDGKFSELACDKLECTLSYGGVRSGAAEKVLKFELIGRMPDFVSGNYRFFETGGGVSISVDVVCNDQDRLKIQATEDQDVTCRQAFGTVEERLLFDGMTISDSTGIRDDLIVLGSDMKQ